MKTVLSSTLFCFSLLGLHVLATEPLERFKPKEPEPMANTHATKPETKPVVPPSAKGAVSLKARGFVFVGALPQFRSGGLSGIDGVKTDGVPLLDNAAFRERMAPYVGTAVSMELVQAVAQETINYYVEHGRPVMRVTAPEQDVTTGVIQFLVTEGHLSEVRVTGNRWFKSSLFKTSIKPGDPILMSALDADTAFYGRNPFRSVTAELSAGKNSGETDVTLRVQDKFPLRVYAGYDNSGVKSTGENRFFTGFNYGNFLGLGHELSYQFSASDDFDQLLAHSATWTIPLPWKHLLQLSGTYSESHPELGSDFDLSGTSWQVGAHYTVPLPSIGKYKHDITLGYDFKYTDNNLQFGGEQVFDTPVDISQFSLAYNASRADKFGRTSLSLAGFWSPGGMSSHNNDESFDATRQDSKADYFYATLGIDRITKLPLGMTWSFSAKGQLSSGNLQATEQFLLGGASTVRGYDELIAAGDQGILVRNEIYSPSFSVAKLVGLKSVHDEFQVLAFHDYGHTGSKHPLDGEDKSVDLQSFGVGARWQIRQNVSAHFDYGWQITHLGDDHSRAHLGVTISF